MSKEFESSMLDVALHFAEHIEKHLIPNLLLCISHIRGAAARAEAYFHVAERKAQAELEEFNRQRALAHVAEMIRREAASRSTRQIKRRKTKSAAVRNRRVKSKKRK